MRSGRIIIAIMLLFAIHKIFGTNLKSVEPNENLYAVIIIGQDDMPFWNDASAIYCALKDAGYTDVNIIVHYGSMNSQYYNDFDNDDIIDFDFKATKNEIRSTFEFLQDVLEPDDQLFVYLGGHGVTSNGNSAILLSSAALLYDYELEEYVQNINCAQMIFLMAQCYSGGFVDNIMHYKGDPTISVGCKNRIIQTSCSSTEKGWMEYWITGGNAVEFSYYWSAAVRQKYYTKWGWRTYESSPGEFPFTEFDNFEDHPSDYNSDLNEDGFIQMDEAFNYANNLDSYSIDDYYYYPYPYPITTIPRYETPQMESRVGFMEDLLSLSGICGRVITTQIVDGNFMVNPSLTIDPQVSLTLSEETKMYCSGSLSIEEDASITLLSGSELTIKPNCSLILKDGSELIVEDGASFVLEEGARIQINRNAKITGNIINILGRIAVTDNSKLTIGSGSNLVLRYIPVSSVILGNNSELIIEPEAVLSYGPTTTTDCGIGSQITVQNGGTLRAGEYSKFTSSDSWVGIVAEVGSTISTYSATISNAEWGINAQAAKVNLIHTYFSKCENGVWLLNCSDYNLNDNYFDGKGTGTGVRVTESTGVLRSNTILNHTAGIVAISCSPLISENYLHDNATCGIALYGYNTYPQLLNPSVSNDELNNRIINNGLTTTGENGSQIFMMYRANAYMNNGYNNIYSGDENSIPIVPCIKTVSDIGVSQQLKSEVSQIVTIPAEGNYWGVGEIPADNTAYFNLYRELQKGYGIDYTPNAVEPFESDGNQPPLYSGNEPPSQEEQLLKVAMMLEDNENYKPAIKKYEKLISSYPDTPEYYVATSRLPQVLAKQEESLEPLIRTYDDALVSENISNKDFIKQMKVSTNIKSKKYDDAILLAEELKASAETDMEKTLCDIEIAICNLMKNSQQKKSSSGNDLTAVNKLVEDLIGEEKSGPAFVKNTVVPESTILHQNYPNPFNPVTQIRFDLANAADVKLSVYNISGQLVSQLANGTMNVGVHAVDFDGSKLNSGIYYYTLEVDGTAMTKKMVLTK